MSKKTFANLNTLDFYKILPFNLKSSLEEEIKTIRRRRREDLYPGLKQLLVSNASVLEVGCGIGWLSNSISFLYNLPVLGIDFNPLAIDVAKGVAKAMGLKSRFQEEDLFLYKPLCPFDVVVSFGCLHHTNNCEAAVRRLCEKFVRPGGHVMIGLYHKYGRRPFLDHFEKMKKRGATETEMLARYSVLQSNLKDQTHLLSWFRDQVLHPHETQHTLEEMLPILQGANMDLVSTSINHFQPIGSIHDLIKKETDYEAIAVKKLQDNQYFPGFFIFTARKKP